MNDATADSTGRAAWNVDDETARKLHGASALMLGLLALGIFMMFTALLDESAVWTGYILLTGWLGLAAGFGAAPSWARYKLNMYNDPPPYQNVLPTWFWGLFNFWLPSFAVILFGAMLAQVLDQQDLSPRHGGKLLQSLAFYFNAAGACWSGLWRATR